MIAAMDRTTFCRHAAVCLLTLFMAPPTHVSADVKPFVAGFERFARHGDVDSVTAGRLLLTELNCTACHAAGPEILPKRGPNLGGVGNRVSHRWLARFLADPQKTSPGTTMPRMLNGLSEAERADTLEALAAFLVSQRKPFPEIKGTGARPVPLEFWNRGQAERGRQLYHRIGCVACHAADPSYETVETKPTPLVRLFEQLDPDELEELGLSAAARRVRSVPHGDLAAKYSRKSLTYFLMDPHTVRPGGRMPNFNLTVDEASDLSAWLLRDQAPEFLGSFRDSPEFTPALAAKGARLFRSHGCAACHTIDELKPPTAAKSLTSLNLDAEESCVADPSQGLPHFALDDEQLAAIRSALNDTAQFASATQDAPAEQVRFQFLKLNCAACHERGKLGGVGRYRRAYFETFGHIDIGDEGRLPPPLTNVGNKLKPSWTAKVLQGAGAIRPHMRIRMPVFPASQVKSLPALLARADAEIGRKQSTASEFSGDLSNLAEAGRQLLDTGCVQCHPLRSEALPGVVGVDLAGIADRLQPAWFHDFLLNPGALKPRTRMPTFFPAGKSQNLTVLDGNTERQIAAMWAYLKDINRQKLPSKIEQARSQNYELIPTDRPILLRTFMDEAGTHAVAVGFPAKIHFAYDSEGLYPAFAWKGRFLDARGTWFERFTPPAKPLDAGGVFLPRGVSIAVPDDTDAAWPVPTESPDYRYLGHRLDKSGIPTFRYQLRNFLIEDRLTPNVNGFLRELTITDQSQAKPRTVQFMAHSGSELDRDGVQCSDAAGLTVRVPREFIEQGRMVKRDGVVQWLLPVTVDENRKLEVHYEW